MPVRDPTIQCALESNNLSDMLGFKLDATRSTTEDKAQPIYLDMQVRHAFSRDACASSFA